MDEPKDAIVIPIPNKLGLAEICKRISRAEEFISRILTPADFGHVFTNTTKTLSVSIPSLPELRRILSIGEDDSAYGFVMRSIGHTSAEISKAIRGEPQRPYRAPPKIRLAEVPEEKPESTPAIAPPPMIEPLPKPAVIQKMPEPEPEPQPKPVMPKVQKIVTPIPVVIKFPSWEPEKEKPPVDPKAVRPLIPKKNFGKYEAPIKKPESE